MHLSEQRHLHGACSCRGRRTHRASRRVAQGVQGDSRSAPFVLVLSIASKLRSSSPCSVQLQPTHFAHCCASLDCQVVHYVFC